MAHPVVGTLQIQTHVDSKEAPVEGAIRHNRQWQVWDGDASQYVACDSWSDAEDIGIRELSDELSFTNTSREILKDCDPDRFGVLTVSFKSLQEAKDAFEEAKTWKYFDRFLGVVAQVLKIALVVGAIIAIANPVGAAAFLTSAIAYLGLSSTVVVTAKTAMIIGIAFLGARVAKSFIWDSIRSKEEPTWKGAFGSTIVSSYFVNQWRKVGVAASNLNDQAQAVVSYLQYLSKPSDLQQTLEKLDKHIETLGKLVKTRKGGKVIVENEDAAKYRKAIEARKQLINAQKFLADKRLSIITDDVAKELQNNNADDNEDIPVDPVLRDDDLLRDDDFHAEAVD